MATGLSSYSKRCKAQKSSLTSWFDSSIASIAERLARCVPWVLRHSDVERIFYLDAQVADRGLQLGVAEQELDGSQVLGLAIDERSLGAPHGVRAMRVVPGRFHPSNRERCGRIALFRDAVPAAGVAARSDDCWSAQTAIGCHPTQRPQCPRQRSRRSLAT